MTAKNERYFHISEILMMHTGITLASVEPRILPDGTTRPAWRTNLTPMIELAGHVMGKSFWVNPTGATDKDGSCNREFYEVLDDVTDSLKRQFAWLKDVETPDFPNKTPEGEEIPQEQRDKDIQQWVREVANRVGGEWWLVKTDPPQMQPKPFIGFSPN